LGRFLVISKGTIHPSPCCRIRLAGILNRIQGSEFSFSGRFSSLRKLDSGGWDGAILFFHKKRIDDKSLSSLIHFVEEGGGLFCIHGALASFKTYGDYTGLTGAEFKGHDKIGPIHIEGDREYSITDELYGFRLRDDCDVIQYGNGKPVYWSGKYKKGTVVGLAPGHRAQTFDNPGFIETIQDGIRRLDEGGTQ
jgi:type 1 glutamine amidotransferase